jgi:hypothetical protein
MRKLAVAFVIGACASSAFAEVVIPAGTLLSAQVSLFDQKAIRAQIVAPTKIATAWDEFAASLAGCTVLGAHGSNKEHRMAAHFYSLVCPGKLAVKFDGVASSPTTQNVGLDSGAPGTPVDVLLLRPVSKP